MQVEVRRRKVCETHYSSVEGLEVRGISVRLLSKTNLNNFLLLTSFPCYFHPPFWLHTPLQHLLSFSFFTPPPSTRLSSPLSRLCCLNPSSCATETLANVAVAGLHLLLARALVLQSSKLMTAVITLINSKIDSTAYESLKRFMNMALCQCSEIIYN